MNYFWFDSLSIGQEISIYGRKYICRGKSLCRSNNNHFCEFILYNKNKKIYKYLEIELIDTNKYELCLYSDIDINRYTDLMNNEFLNSETYSSKATVEKRKGSFDADIGETYSYTEYYSDNKILSVENWDGEIEYSYGKDVRLENIFLGDIVEKATYNKKPIIIVSIVAAVFLFFTMFKPSTIFASYCSPTCSRENKDWCCQNGTKCSITNKACKSISHASSGSIRNSSSGARTPIGGGTSFGK